MISDGYPEKCEPVHPIETVHDNMQHTCSHGLDVDAAHALSVAVQALLGGGLTTEARPLLDRLVSILKR